MSRRGGTTRWLAPFDPIIVVVVAQDGSVAWLLEVFADAFSSPLRPHAVLIEALTALAVAGGRGLDRRTALALIDTAVTRVG